LYENVGINLAGNTYVQGSLHPRKENGVLDFKGLGETELKKHDALKKTKRRQIWPARRSQELESTVQGGEDFCNEICGSRTAANGIAW
jgi:hypothetical protein